MIMTEVTVQVFETLEKVKSVLGSAGFSFIETYYINDYYFSRFDNEELNKMKYIDILDNSFLVREIKDESCKVQLIYKKKEVDDEENVLHEEKVKLNVDSLENALKIFNFSKINNWIKLKNTTYVYKKGEIKLLVQQVEDLGLFIELEEFGSISNLRDKEKVEYMISFLKTFNLQFGEDFSCKKVYMKFLNSLKI